MHVVNITTQSKVVSNTTNQLEKVGSIESKNEEVTPANSDLLAYHQKSAYYIDDLGIDLSKYKRSDEEIEKQSKIDKDVYEVVSKYYTTHPSDEDYIKRTDPYIRYLGAGREILDPFIYLSIADGVNNVGPFEVIDSLLGKDYEIFSKKIEFTNKMYEKYGFFIQKYESYFKNKNIDDTLEVLKELGLLNKHEIETYENLKELTKLENSEIYKVYKKADYDPINGFFFNFKYYKNEEEFENERKDYIKNLYRLKKDLDDETYEEIVEKYNEAMERKKEEAIKNGLYNPNDSSFRQVLYKDELDIYGAALIRDDIIYKGYSKSEWIGYFERQNSKMQKALEIYEKFGIKDKPNINELYIYDQFSTLSNYEKDHYDELLWSGKLKNVGPQMMDSIEDYKILIDNNNKIIDELKDRWGYGDLDLSA